jgi:hypothetical protein
MRSIIVWAALAAAYVITAFAQVQPPPPPTPPAPVSGGIAAGATITGCPAGAELFTLSTLKLGCSANFTSNDTTTFITVPNGTTAAPGIGGQNSPTTGISWPSAGTFAFSSAGTNVADFGVTSANQWCFKPLGGTSGSLCIGQSGSASQVDMNVNGSASAANFVRIQTNITPDANQSYALGTSGLAWTGVFAFNFVAGGSAPANSGTCAINSQLGGNTAGKFAANGVCAAGSIIFTFASAAPNGWACNANDLTTPADTVKQTGFTAGTATFTATMAASDVVTFSGMAF